MVRKSIVTSFVLLFCAAILFAQSAAMKELAQAYPSELDYTEEEITVVKGENYVLTIKYHPAVDEAYFVYETPTALFDQGDAMNVIHQQAMAFQRSHSYFSYVYTRKDVTRYNNDDDTAIYTSFIRFSK